MLQAFRNKKQLQQPFASTVSVFGVCGVCGWCRWYAFAWPLCQGAEWRTNWIVASETNRKRCDHHPSIPFMRPRHSSVGLEVTTPKLLMCINLVGISWLISYAESTSWEKDVLFPEKPPQPLTYSPNLFSYHTILGSMNLHLAAIQGLPRLPGF